MMQMKKLMGPACLMLLAGNAFAREKIEKWGIRLNDGWNGYCNGVLQPAGAYIWVAEGKDLLGVIVKDKGSFILIK